eukprot:CAMPEP_0179348590 /NCGR_PEP_ID=MMETSP0797-20121207/73783_1 /TAXON_ID=47934 /ORGANISM="Dinophysis acuminata, Strain DAEP01" /LENGTH=460 /DNA_ID=CAMNT_0021063405 /DNA_START=98 /DNA_END=1480 /DNA_ORIENTATION=-
MKRPAGVAEEGTGKRERLDQDSSMIPPDAATYRTVTVFRSQRDTQERLSNVATLTLGQDESAGAQDASIFVSLDAVDSKPFLGVGGSFTEAAAVVFHKMNEATQAEILKAYFDPNEGLGYSLGRISIASCDFGLGNWNCGDLEEGDAELRGFSIGRYKEAILPMLQRATAARGGQLTLVPGALPGVGVALVKYVQAMAGAGVDIWAVTVQNEPEAAQTWESCIYTAEEERDFVRDHLGPALARHGLGAVKIIIWDHNRDGMLERASALLRARAGFENVRRVADLRPDKHVLFTEGCQELGGRPLREVLGHWSLGERYALNMVRDLASGCEGWIDWNLCLDEDGGPNHVGNTCSAPIICDTTTGELHYESSFYALGHFSKYIRPGARKLLSSTSRDVLEVVSFLNVDTSIAVVVMNPSGDAVSFWLKLGGASAVKTDHQVIRSQRFLSTRVAADSQDESLP